MVDNGLVLTNEQETTGPAFPWCLKGIASDSKSQVLFHSRQKESRQYSFSEKKKKKESALPVLSVVPQELFIPIMYEEMC